MTAMPDDTFTYSKGKIMTTDIFTQFGYNTSQEKPQKCTWDGDIQFSDDNVVEIWLSRPLRWAVVFTENDTTSYYYLSDAQMDVIETMAQKRNARRYSRTYSQTTIIDFTENLNPYTACVGSWSFYGSPADKERADAFHDSPLFHAIYEAECITYQLDENTYEVEIGGRTEQIVWLSFKNEFMQPYYQADTQAQYADMLQWIDDNDEVTLVEREDSALAVVISYDKSLKGTARQAHPVLAASDKFTIDAEVFSK